jgi:hypothetical protein
MRKRSGQHSRVAIWTGWLLGGAFVLALAVGSMTLSTDGARLKRLFNGGSGGRRDAPAATIASYGRPASAESPQAVLEPPEPAGPPEAPSAPVEAQSGPLDAQTGPSVTLSGGFEAQSEPVTAIKKPGGCVLAEVIGPSENVDVLLDGEWKGVAPVLIKQIPPGKHTLTFQSGAVNWDEQVRVWAGDTTMVACVAPDEGLFKATENGQHSQGAPGK